MRSLVALQNVSRTSGVLADEVALVLCIEVRVIRQEKNINPGELCGQDFVLRLHSPERVLPQACRIVRAKSGPDGNRWLRSGDQITAKIEQVGTWNMGHSNNRWPG